MGLTIKQILMHQVVGDLEKGALPLLLGNPYLVQIYMAELFFLILDFRHIGNSIKDGRQQSR